ncbi:hypothetical protein QWJ34_12155 [Saccharibacillus sp. CPCC 101409]|uniref:hypothetical protein n=1 Tax=Saccharibacillus sp. CPCC 101409 TaxID=3058041 RepID=UPI0026710493|nr:hypothetical protein [Saccharibacillus sp. CPCC 101409]MDO3410515.1 hypothetical protein [Saccharibacillus sp. CPCC 101409]
MVYDYQGFIGRADVLSAAGARYKNVKLIRLTGDLATIPLTEELQGEINAGEGRFVADSDFLTEQIEAAGRSLSANGTVAYAEAEYFGGWGDQTCRVWDRGIELLAEDRRDGAINHALQKLGVTRAEGKDEFDTVGMGRHRQVRCWADDTEHEIVPPQRSEFRRKQEP